MNPYPPTYYSPQQNLVPQDPLSGLTSTAKIIFSIMIPLLWFVALWLPAYTNGTKGAVCLLFGWSMLVTGNGLAFLAWMANIPFIIGIFMFLLSKRKKVHNVTLVMGIISFIFSLGALTVTKIESDIVSGMDSVDPYIGTLVWSLSMLLLVVGSIVSIALPSVIPPPVPMQQPNYYPPQNYPPQNYYPNYPPNYTQPQQQNYPPQIPEHFQSDQQNPFANPSDSHTQHSHNHPSNHDHFPPSNDSFPPSDNSHHSGHDSNDSHHHH